MKLKTLLCTPLEGYSTKSPMSPLGLAFIAGTLEKENYEVKILDNYLEKFNPESFLKKVRKYDPDVVGITCHVEDRFGAFKTAKLLKDLNPNIKIIFGGPFPTICHKQIIEDIPSVDIVVRHEGEVTFVELLNSIKNEKDFDNVRGITYKRNNNIKINKDRPFIKDLDELPWPAFHLLEIKRYPSYLEEYSKHFLGEYDKEKIRYTASLIFGRGCPFNCQFCSSKEMWKRTYRIISPENAVSQINYFVEKGIDGFAFWDDHLTLNKKWFMEFADEIKKEKIDIQFKCLGRVDSINEEVGRTLHEIGCRMITLGIENGSPRILKIMNKKITPQQSENAVALLYKNEICSYGGCIVNNPGEKLDDITLSLKFFKKLEEKYSLMAGTPVPVAIYPGSDLERVAISDGHLKNFRWSEWYFEKRNLIGRASPYTPLYENIPTEYLIRYIVKESLRLGYHGLLRNLIVQMMNVANFNLLGGLKAQNILLLGILDCIAESPWKNKPNYIYDVFNETLSYKLKKLI